MSTDQRYALAQEEGLPPYMWVPPKTLPLVPTHNERQGIAEGEEYCPQPERMRTLATFNRHCEAPRQFEATAGEEKVDASHEKLTKTPHPFSDFRHQHPQELAAHGHGSVPEPFQRLALAYDWILCKAYKLLNALNDAATGDPSTYSQARKDYLDFVRNLDNHEPMQKRGQVDPAKCLGYGKVVKWVYIDPIVQAKGPGNTPVITGATVVIEWNPHSSSSGIPIQHK